MDNLYVAPSYGSTGFNCPHCGVRAVQKWGSIYKSDMGKGNGPRHFDTEDLEEWEQKAKDSETKEASERVLKYVRRVMAGEVFIDGESDSRWVAAVGNLFVTVCDHCLGVSVWLAGNIVYPTTGDIPPHVDLPVPIQRTFNEAAQIVAFSPRASAALARLALQQLCIHLECKKRDLNDQIGELVARGLSREIQQMLDAVRVIGNNAVHPGQIDIEDDQDTARFLLNCINRICQRMITEPREAQALYDQLPEGVRARIEHRDRSRNQSVEE